MKKTQVKEKLRKVCKEYFDGLSPIFVILYFLFSEDTKKSLSYLSVLGIIPSLDRVTCSYDPSFSLYVDRSFNIDDNLYFFQFSPISLLSKMADNNPLLYFFKLS